MPAAGHCLDQARALPTAASRGGRPELVGIFTAGLVRWR
jgi:hypothetical protein